MVRKNVGPSCAACVGSSYQCARNRTHTEFAAALSFYANPRASAVYALAPDLVLGFVAIPVLEIKHGLAVLGSILHAT